MSFHNLDQHSNNQDDGMSTANYDESEQIDEEVPSNVMKNDVNDAKLKWLRKRWEQKKKEIDEMSFMKRFLKSDTNEFMFLKFIIGLPCGFFAGFVLYYTILSHLEIEPMNLRMQFALGFITFYALTFALSASMRCITYLLVPNMFGGSGRFYLYAVLLSILISGPLGTMVSNGHEVFRSFLCGFNLIKNQTKISLTVTLIPLLDVLINLVKNQDEFLTEVSKLGDKIKEFLDSMIYPELSEYANARVASSKSKDESKVNLEEVFKDEDRSMESYRRKKAVQERVEAYFQVVRTKCQAMIDWAQDKCVELWNQLLFICCVLLCIFFWICFIIFPFNRCRVTEMPRQYLGYDCEDIGKEEMGDEYAEKILRLRRMVDEFFNKFEAKFQYEVPDKDEDETIMMVTSEQIESVIDQAFAYKNMIVEFTTKTLMRCIPFLFVAVLYQSHKYLERFITDITFDNNYITSYFLHVDNRRKMMMKRFILPLKKMESKDIKELFSHRFTKKDLMILATSVSWIITLTIYFTIAFAIDYCFASLLQLFRLYGAIDFVHNGYHELNVTVTGDGLLSRVLRFFTKGFNQKKSLYVETTNRVCLPVPMFTPLKTYFEVYAFLLVILAFYFVEPHLKKYRSVIAGFIFRKRQKKRIIYLYNDMLRRRVGYLHQARHKIRRSVKNDSFTMTIGFFLALRYALPGKFEWLLRLGLGKQQCIICKEKENELFRHCPTFLCKAVYCPGCWVDIGFRCYACRDNDDWSESSGELCHQRKKKELKQMTKRRRRPEKRQRPRVKRREPKVVTRKRKNDTRYDSN